MLYILEKLNQEDHPTFTNICKHATLTTNNVTDIRLIIGCCSLSIGICCALIAKNIYQLSTFLQNNIKGYYVVTAGLISIGGILIANSLFKHKTTSNYLSQDHASPGLVTAYSLRTV